MVVIEITTINIFTKLIFQSCVLPHSKGMWMKNLITTCFFHVDGFLHLILLFQFSWDDQDGRCFSFFFVRVDVGLFIHVFHAFYIHINVELFLHAFLHLYDGENQVC